MKNARAGLMGTVLATALLALAVGCETSSKTSVLTIKPSSVVLNPGDRIVVLTAHAPAHVTNGTNAVAAQLPSMSMPVRWTVANPEMGQIIAYDGTRATYARTTKRGISIVTARDQGGAEGFATIDQR